MDRIRRDHRKLDPKQACLVSGLLPGPTQRRLRQMRRRAYGSWSSMTFTTLTFLLFLALFFALYWVLRNRTVQNLLIVAASYFFYGWWDWRF